MEQETALVRAGKMRTPPMLGRTKIELAGELYACGERLKTNAKFLLARRAGALRGAARVCRTRSAPCCRRT